MKDKRPIEQQVADLTADQKQKLGKIFWTQLIVVILLVATCLTIIVCGSITIHQANTELDQLQFQIDMEDPLEYNAALHDQYWVAWDKLDAAWEFYPILLIVYGAIAMAALVIMMVVTAKKFPYYSEKKYFYVRKHKLI